MADARRPRNALDEAAAIAWQWKAVLADINVAAQLRDPSRRADLIEAMDRPRGYVPGPHPS